jgi:hypothetical protein
MPGSTHTNACSPISAMAATVAVCLACGPALSDPRAMPMALSVDGAHAPTAYVDAQLAASRNFVDQAMAQTQQTLASLMAANVTASSSWMLDPPGTNQTRLADYAAAQRAALENYGDLLRQRHNRISIAFDERAAEVTLSFLNTGFLQPVPHVVPITPLPPPLLILPELAASFPGLTPVAGGFFASAPHQP